MASGTLIFRPSSDVSLGHTLSSGSDGFRLIADTTADDNSTYLSHALSSTTSGSINSVFTLTTSTLPSYDYKITAVRLYSRVMGASNNGSGSYTCYFAAGTAAGGSSNNSATTGSATSGSYETVSSASTEMLSTINNSLEEDRELPVFSVKITTTGAKSSDKNASNGYIRVTQVYMELDYEDTVFAPPPEQAGTTYYSITASSINATTDPANGTTRIAQGGNYSINIYPTDPVFTSATDNGVNIKSQMIEHMYSHDYTVTGTVSGASYGFTLNSNTGYYVSGNAGQGNSASVCRVNFNFDTAAAVTISYINYAQATYDYGIFGNIDTALGTTYTADTNAFYRCNTSADNTSAVKTLTYNIPAGSHFIDIKYRKNNTTNQNNDNLQWKISDITVTGATAWYTYNLSNISAKHNLMFVFGNATYYTVTSNGTNCRVFPDGQVIVMPGNTYTINIVPNTVTDVIGLTDNGVNVTSSLIKEKGTDGSGNTIASYSYELTNVRANHDLEIVGVQPDSLLYHKVSGSWSPVLDAYYKENGRWVKKDLSFFADMDLTYVKKGIN